MAFALALQSVHDLPEGHGQTIFTATTAIVVLTVLLIGGSTGTMLEALDVVGGDSHDDSPLASVGTITSYDGNNGYIAPSYSEESSSSGNKIKMKLKEFHKSAASFTALDRNYLTPFFTSQNGDEDEEGEALGIEWERGEMGGDSCSGGWFGNGPVVGGSGRVGGTRKQGKVELDLEEPEEVKNRDEEFENWWPVRKGNLCPRKS
ncbi:hypothetical protein SESBI_14112 [Sesbania bispinosa]|nr:hypothetical protein SESBI_14112 [Sesbania bispinosa]